MSPRERLVVIGGDAAGMSAAAQARRRRSVDELEIVAFERGAYTSYSACGLPYLVSGQIDDVDALVARSPATHRAMGIDVRTGSQVVALDLDARTVTVRGADAEVVEPFDGLVIATGAVPARPPLPGIDADGVFGIQTLGDGIALRDAAQRASERRAVVVGGGYIGLEMAEAMHQRGFAVTVIDAGPQPLAGLDPDMGAIVARAMRSIGIELLTDTRVDAIETDATGRARGVVAAGEQHAADIVVLGIGVHPNVELARAAGVRIGDAGGVATDDHMATSAPGVWAAGDCVETRHRITGRSVFVPLGTHANKQGRVAGINATGGDAAFPGVIGTAVTKICAYEIGRTGLSEREARAAGFDFAAARIDSTARAGYYPGATPITIKVVAERGTGRLLGAQIIGQEGAVKRIDVLATAIWAGMTADELSQIDLGYAPPFAPVWDGALVAARKVAALV